MVKEKILITKNNIITLLVSIIIGLLFGWIAFFVALMAVFFIAKKLGPKLMIEDQRDKNK
tara:strand:+ start:364 stop:543 length:180 start_codon:yes stop_codon:yes gene_type:complete